MTVARACSFDKPTGQGTILPASVFAAARDSHSRLLARYLEFGRHRYIVFARIDRLRKITVDSLMFRARAPGRRGPILSTFYQEDRYKRTKERLGGRAVRPATRVRGIPRSQTTLIDRRHGQRLRGFERAGKEVHSGAARRASSREKGAEARCRMSDEETWVPATLMSPRRTSSIHDRRDLFRGRAEELTEKGLLKALKTKGQAI